MEHTPTPWRQVDGIGAMVINLDGNVMADCSLQPELDMNEKQANATFIVRAVNVHEDLLDMVYRAIPYLEEITKDPLYKPGAVATTIRKMKEAIAKAEGKQL